MSNQRRSNEERQRGDATRWVDQRRLSSVVERSRLDVRGIDSARGRVARRDALRPEKADTRYITRAESRPIWSVISYGTVASPIGIAILDRVS